MRHALAYRLVLWAATMLAVAGSAVGADWPAYRHDAARSARGAETLATPLRQVWRFRPRQSPLPAWHNPLRDPYPLDFAYARDEPQPVHLDFDQAPQPVGAGGLVYFGSSADDTLRALDLATGRIRWRFTAGGPIRFAPAVWDGRVYVACDDGFLYCRDAATGAEVWRFRAALGEDQLAGQGRVISRWPLRSGVLVDGGVAYVTAGMWPSEGIAVYALDARTGRVLWCNDTSGTTNAPANTAHAYAITGVAPQGYMAASADRLIVPTGRSVPAAYDRATGDLVEYRFTGYQHRSGGAYVMWDQARQLLLFGYPTSRMRLRGKNTSGVHTVRHRRWQRSFSADRVLIGPEAFLRVHGGRVYCEKPNAARKVLWSSPCPAGIGRSIALAGQTLVVGGDDGLAVYDVETGELRWQAGDLEGSVAGLAVVDGRLIASTTTGMVYCFAPGLAAGEAREVRKVPRALAGMPPDVPQAATRALALAQEHGLGRGYALVIGSESARAAAHIARGSDLHVVCLLGDERHARSERRNLVERTGLYGPRIVVQSRADLSRLPYAPYLFNLIVVCGRADELDARELYRVLRPCGGVLSFQGLTPERAGAMAAVTGCPKGEVHTDGGAVTVVRGKLPGAFDWNADVRVDQRVRWPLELLWFGPPGPARTAQGGVLTRPANGRCFVIGRHHVIAVDAYNGAELWAQAVPYLQRTLGRLPRLPGPPVRSLLQSLAADDDFVYLNFGDVCYRLDAATGRQRGVYGRFAPGERFALDQPRTFQLQTARRRVVEDTRMPLAPVGEDPAEEPELERRVEWDLALKREHEAWVTLRRTGDGVAVALRATPATCGPEDYWELFFDFRAPERRADLYGPGVFHLVVRPQAGTWERGVGTAHPRRVALGAGEAEGELEVRLRWDEMEQLAGGKPRSFAFGAVFNRRHHGSFARWCTFADDYAYVFNNGWATFGPGGSKDAWEARPDVGALDELPAHAREWGRVPPHTHSAPTRGDHELHAADPRRIVPGFPANEVYGDVPLQRSHALTGLTVPRGFKRGKGCGGRIPSATMEFVRCSTIGFYDFADDSGMRYFGGVRSGCYVSVMPAHGVLFAPESSSLCSCSYNFKTSLALVPTDRRRNEDWALYYEAPQPVALVQGAGINLGAPGDRRDDGGRLWLQWPRPPLRFVLPGPVQMSGGEGLAKWRFNADRVAVPGTDRPWLYASGFRDVRRVVLELFVREDRGPIALACAGPPVIDGKLDDACWDGTGRVGRYDEVYLRHDEEALYLALRREAVFSRRGVRQPWRRGAVGRDAPVWRDDAFQVALRSLGEGGRLACAHFGVSASGATYEALWTAEKLARFGVPKEVGKDEALGLVDLADEVPAGGADQDLEAQMLWDEAEAWDGPWQAAARAGEDDFVVEVAIPWTALERAGLAREGLTVDVAWPGRPAGEPLEIARALTHSEKFVPLVRPDLPAGPRPHTVRLHFLEPDDVREGERVFDVRLQGRTVVTGLDVVHEAGGRRRALVKEWRDVPAERTVVVELVPKGRAATERTVPVLSAVEVVAQQ